MLNHIIEASYPLHFRKEDAERLGEHLRHRHSVELIGMKRVGISNFLRFFLYHKDIVATYISPKEKHIFIPVDFNDLVERELFPFWTLTLKRIDDVTQQIDIPTSDKKIIENLFLKTIQSQDLFLAIDSVRQALVILINHGILPTLFFLRFDRLRDAITPEFFGNLQGLKDATNQKLAYVFTSYRTLDQLSPEVFSRASLSLFAHTMFMKLAKEEDMKIIYSTYNDRYNVPIAQSVENALLALVNGYVQYLQLSLTILHGEKHTVPSTKDKLFSLLIDDERIVLQSEELWESLTEEEKTLLLKASQEQSFTEEEMAEGSYLFDTGFLIEKDGSHTLFSPLFATYVAQLIEKPQAPSVHFSKKEHALFSLLEQHRNSICEREAIVEAVWPESTDFGVSDWAIDRLVARVRTKLRQQNSKYEIRTVRTRGYELVDKQ